MLDNSLAPPGQHVVQLFTQWTPYKCRKVSSEISDSNESLNKQETKVSWNAELSKKYADRVFDWIDRYAPGFKSSIIGVDILTPDKLESELGLTGGNIFHGSLRLDQLYWNRPIGKFVGYTLPKEVGGVDGLFLCGSGAHPGGGVIGSAGRLSAFQALKYMKKNKF